MMCSALFNSVGLVLDIIGVLLPFRYGLRRPDVDPSGRDYLWGGDQGVWVTDPGDEAWTRRPLDVETYASGLPQ